MQLRETLHLIHGAPHGLGNLIVGSSGHPILLPNSNTRFPPTELEHVWTMLPPPTEPGLTGQGEEGAGCPPSTLYVARWAQLHMFGVADQGSQPYLAHGWTRHCPSSLPREKKFEYHWFKTSNHLVISGCIDHISYPIYHAILKELVR